MRRFIALVLVCSLTACASVPFSTMWRLRNFAPEDIPTLDPSEIGVAIQLPDELALDEERVTFNIELLRTENGQEELVLEQRTGLDTVERGRQVITPIPAASPGRHWQIFRLSADGRDEFRTFQQTFSSFHWAEGEKALRMSVNPRFANENLLRGKHRITVAIQLSAEDGWFMLLKNAELEFKEREQ